MKGRGSSGEGQACDSWLDGKEQTGGVAVTALKRGQEWLCLPCGWVNSTMNHKVMEGPGGQIIVVEDLIIVRLAANPNASSTGASSTYPTQHSQVGVGVCPHPVELSLLPHPTPHPWK